MDARSRQKQTACTGLVSRQVCTGPTQAEIAIACKTKMPYILDKQMTIILKMTFISWIENPMPYARFAFPLIHHGIPDFTQRLCFRSSLNVVRTTRIQIRRISGFPHWLFSFTILSIIACKSAVQAKP